MEDRRIKKTQRALATAMFTLLEKQDFHKITVNDLCVEAQIGRSTFYAHFEDKYTLLHFSIVLLDEEFYGNMPPATMEEHLYTLLERIRANVRIVKNLMVNSMDAELFATMDKALCTKVEHAIAQQKSPDHLLPGPLEVITAFYSSGLTNAIILWVRRNMPYSTEEMAKCLAALLPVE